MSDTKHSDLMNLPYDYKGQHGNSSAPVGLPSHPKQLVLGATASENVSPATSPHMFKWRRRVRTFDLSKKEDIAAYEDLYDMILSNPHVIDGQTVHYILFREETTAFNGKYTILVQWHLAFFDISENVPAPVSLPNIESVDRRRRAPIKGGGSGTTVTENTAEDYKTLASSMNIPIAKKDPAPASGSRPPIQGVTSSQPPSTPSISSTKDS